MGRPSYYFKTIGKNRNQIIATAQTNVSLTRTMLHRAHMTSCGFNSIKTKSHVYEHIFRCCQTDQCFFLVLVRYHYSYNTRLWLRFLSAKYKQGWINPRSRPLVVIYFNHPFMLACCALIVSGSSSRPACPYFVSLPANGLSVNIGASISCQSFNVLSQIFWNLNYTGGSLTSLGTATFTLPQYVAGSFNVSCSSVWPCDYASSASVNGTG
jgi:hypothetical protein